ncbi:MAG: adenylate/guanylate cyclase domain-containing protein [Caldilineaceae bacterium]
MFNRLSVKSKLTMTLVLVSLISATVIGYLGWQNSRSALTASIMASGVTTRQEKADQIESYFRNMRNQVEILGQNDMIIEAAVRFNRAFAQLENSAIPADYDKALEAYYKNEFFPKLFANLPGQADYELYRPESQAGIYLQYQYIVQNPHPDGEKILLDRATDNSEYSQVHAYYHPRLRELIKKLGYDDLILINAETGNVVYTTAKQTDFASNLDHGPYRNINEAKVVQLVRANSERDTIQLVDFELYRPGYGIPAAFWGSPLYNGSHLVGILLIQISINEIDKIMTYNQNWTHVGLGKTGETYLVGSDLLMRSNSRFLLEDPKSYLATLKSLGASDRSLQLMSKFGTTILFQKLDSPAARAATLQNEEGTILANDYRRVPSLISYQPLVIEGLQWGLVNKMSEDEVFAPIYKFQRQLLIAMVILVILFAFIAVAIGWFFMRPVNVLIEGARRVSAGEYNTEIKLQTQDELGELSRAFNTMIQGIRQQTNVLAQKNQEIERLLLNVLPSAAARRVQKGETSIVEQIQQVTVLYVSISGFQELAAKKAAQEVAGMLQDLTIDMDESADRYDVEKLATAGQRFIAVCGLSTQHLDHSRRAADFALSLLRIVQRVNSKYTINLNLRVGVHAGAIMAGVIGVNRIMYEMWGETVNIASYLNEDAGPNTILVSQEIYERLHEQYKFRRQTTPHRDQPRPVAWALEGNANGSNGQVNGKAEAVVAQPQSTRR